MSTNKKECARGGERNVKKKMKESDSGSWRGSGRKNGKGSEREKDSGNESESGREKGTEGGK